VRALATDLVQRPFSLVAVGATDEAAFRGVTGAVPASAPTSLV
jgi:hypothetical protein